MQGALAAACGPAASPVLYPHKVYSLGRNPTVKKVLVSLAAIVVLGLSSSAKADTLTFTPTPVDLNDLDHHSVYTWRVDNVNLHGQTITGARITFTNIANWNSETNRLYV